MKPDITFDSAVEGDAARWLPSLVTRLDFSPLSLAVAQPLHVAHVSKVLERLNERWEGQKGEPRRFSGVF